MARKRKPTDRDPPAPDEIGGQMQRIAKKLQRLDRSAKVPRPAELRETVSASDCVEPVDGRDTGGPGAVAQAGSASQLRGSARGHPQAFVAADVHRTASAKTGPDRARAAR